MTLPADHEPITVPVDPRLGAVLPAGAVRLVAAAPAVLLDPSLPEPVAARFAADLGAVPVPDAGSAPAGAVVLVPVADPQAPAGAELLTAVAVMDRLRSPGGCPWDAEQTHESLLRYLVEETYELYDALAAGDVAASREELGDVLLQVLFHARVAAEAEGYDVDDVAAELVAKLVGRHPHVFADGESVATASDQDRRWEELKATEKQRESILDGVAQAQPAAALLAKYVSRAKRAGVPPDLLAAAVPEGVPAAVATAYLAGGDPEGELRAAATALGVHLRATEARLREAGLPSGAAVDGSTWRQHWQ
ncbi:MazG family protein [Actinomycetospora sp. NBRC 106378]|uniref:MazG family protein n=1 Tax=Actinomycetospora sp. NBRC 106378 TaxID=3032208 RepID=UPI0024A4B7E2|nr:MazG family protein [Actinomycetospora sp. NBRC 106378]GLZ55153.1 nucleoside triphosphate pyrophosphohydrolase [Actinomycetospora sp. NBRC 106378]